MNIKLSFNSASKTLFIQLPPTWTRLQRKTFLLLLKVYNISKCYKKEHRNAMLAKRVTRIELAT